MSASRLPLVVERDDGKFSIEVHPGVRLLWWFNGRSCNVRIETDFDADYQVTDSGTSLDLRMQ
jgi:hypothetical protein